MPLCRRTADDKPNLSAPVPKAADGKPSLTGLWVRVRSSRERVTVLAMGRNLEDFMRPGEKIPPLLPAAEALIATAWGTSWRTGPNRTH